MIRCNFLLRRVLEVLHARGHLPQVSVTQAAVEEDLAREEPELQAQLLVIDGGVATQVEQSVIEIGQRLLEITQQKVRHSLLEVGNGEILVQTDGTLVTLDLRFVSIRVVHVRPQTYIPLFHVRPGWHKSHRS